MMGAIGLDFRDKLPPKSNEKLSLTIFWTNIIRINYPAIFQFLITSHSSAVTDSPSNSSSKKK